MINPTLISVLALATYFIYAGWYRRVLLESDVLQGKDRFATFFETVASVFTVVGAGEYALVILLVGPYGVAAPSVFIALALALFLIAIVAPKVRRLALKDSFPTTTVDGFPNFTTPDLFYACFGRAVSTVATAITALAFTGILWVQFILGGEIIASLANVPYWMGVALIAVAVAVYVCLGRFPAILHTDTYQGTLMWVTLYVFIVYAYFGTPRGFDLSRSLNTIGTATTSFISGYLEDPTALTILLRLLAKIT